MTTQKAKKLWKRKLQNTFSNIFTTPQFFAFAVDLFLEMLLHGFFLRLLLIYLLLFFAFCWVVWLQRFFFLEWCSAFIYFFILAMPPCFPSFCALATLFVFAHFQYFHVDVNMDWESKSNCPIILLFVWCFRSFIYLYADRSSFTCVYAIYFHSTTE